MERYIVGIDEAGRGPLAGPVSVAAVAIRSVDYSKFVRELKGLRDSKKLSKIKREEWNFFLRKQPKSLIRFSVTLVKNNTIDKRGISFAVRKGVKKSLEKISVKPREAKILLDGSLFAPKEFIFQKTIIRGDEKEKLIMLASVLAKVHRDGYMVRKSKEYSGYGFEIHKGYGTKSHIKKIKNLGPCLIHRRTFITKLTK